MKVVVNDGSSKTSASSDRDQQLRTLEASIKPLEKRLEELLASMKENSTLEEAKIKSLQKRLEELAPSREESPPKTNDDDVFRSNPLPHLSLPGSYYSFGGPSSNDGVGKVGKIFRQGALIGFMIWVFNLFVVFRYSPAEIYEAPHGIEQNTHILSFILLLVTNGSRILPLAIRDSNLDFAKNGVLVGTFAVQCIALVSNILLSFFPTPVLIDEISGLRVHLLRWAEWIPLAFLMTFLTDNIDAPLKPDNSKPKYMLAICLTLSTAAGAVFPFCPNLTSWLIVFTVSWLLFCALYVKLYTQAKRYYAFKTARPHQRESSAFKEECYELARSSFVLTGACTATWTMLAVTFSIICLAPAYAPPGSIFASPALSVVTTSIFEVASKIWYLSALVEAYEKVFDESTRAVRQLEELRNFMSTVWESSSDVIVFCGQREGRINARISPAFLKMVGLATGWLPFLDRGDVSLVLEILPEKGIFYIFAIDLSKPVTREDASKIKKSLKAEKRNLTSAVDVSTDDKNVAIMARLAVKACAMKGAKGVENSFMEDLFTRNERGQESKVRCEARIAKLDQDSSVIIFRDISDRLQCFEAEKQLVKEVTIRRKDEEANRFTRHEVKNGILAAMGLVDHLRESMQRAEAESNGKGQDHLGTAHSAAEEQNPEAALHWSLSDKSSLDELEAGGTIDLQGSFDEIENTLTDILDTILDEAMAREIVHGEYEPKKERLDVPAVLASIRRRSSRRFPLNVVPDPFPRLALDRQLLRYIYRNAVSNACKYGKPDGVIDTRVLYNEKEGTFKMEVINLPGPGHPELEMLNEHQVASIFSQGTQLVATHATDTVQAEIIRNESSGNGAWIIQKCAEALGGKCYMQFEPARTVFSFTSPVGENVIELETGSSQEDEDFLLPGETHGIVIDDSMIQRKLLDRFLGMAGISKSRRHVLGKNADEVFGFCEYVANQMKKYPNDKFLVIADENLDIVDGGARHLTVSGSRCVEKLRESLDEATESRLLALIRSANDSAKDLELYRNRAHGYMLKEPVKDQSLLDIIKPWWTARFPNSSKGRASVLYTRSSSNSYGPSAKDIENALKVVDALCTAQDGSAIKMRWLAIREKLHTLKGDIKTMKSKESLSEILKHLDRLVQHTHLPSNFAKRWSDVRSQIEAII
jgi:hypothetical protein